MARTRNLARRGAEWLHRKQRDHASQIVIYCRGEDRCQCEALIGKTEFEAIDEEGIATITESRDFLIRADELTLSTGAIEPRRGDTIHERHTKTTVVYEINAPKGQRCFARDLFRDRFRIHTKEIDSY